MSNRRMLMLFERNGVAGRVWPPYCRDSVIPEVMADQGQLAALLLRA